METATTPNSLDLFASFINMHKDQQPAPPQGDVLHAKHFLINEESDELVIGDSHLSRLLNNLGKNQSSFLIYPGVVITKQDEFHKIRDDINHILVNENLNIKKIVLSFGGNDVQWLLQSKIKSDEIKFVSDHIVKGNMNIDWSDVNPSDPLNLFNAVFVNSALL